jgi:PAS domain S-box-containing protein
MNDAIVRFLGTTRSRMIGHSDFDLFEREQAEYFWQQDEQAMASNQHLEYEEPFVTVAGEKRWVLKQKRSVILADGSRYLIGSIIDITERRRAQVEIENSRRFLERTHRRHPEPAVREGSRTPLGRDQRGVLPFRQPTPRSAARQDRCGFHVARASRDGVRGGRCRVRDPGPDVDRAVSESAGRICALGAQEQERDLVAGRTGLSGGSAYRHQ